MNVELARKVLGNVPTDDQIRNVIAITMLAQSQKIDIDAALSAAVPWIGTRAQRVAMPSVVESDSYDAVAEAVRVIRVDTTGAFEKLSVMKPTAAERVHRLQSMLPEPLRAKRGPILGAYALMFSAPTQRHRLVCDMVLGGQVSTRLHEALCDG